MFALPLALILNHLATTTNAWNIQTILPFRLLGTIAIEGVLWGTLLVFLIASLYETLFWKEELKFKKDTGKKLRQVGMLLGGLFIGLLFVDPLKLQFPYSYLVTGIVVMLVPTTWFLITRPSKIAPFLKVTGYIFCLAVAFEITGLKLNQWEFTSTEFIGWISLLGYKFPIEEFVFFFVLVTPCTLSYYELLAKNAI
jgi:hypothetical protein